MVGRCFFCDECWTEFWFPTAVSGLLPFAWVWFVNRIIDVFNMGRPSCGSKCVYSSMFSHFVSSGVGVFLLAHWSSSDSVRTFCMEFVMKPFCTSSIKLSHAVTYLWACGPDSVVDNSYPSAIWYLFSFCGRVDGDNLCRFLFWKCREKVFRFIFAWKIFSLCFFGRYYNRSYKNFLGANNITCPLMEYVNETKKIVDFDDVVQNTLNNGPSESISESKLARLPFSMVPH